MLAVCLTGQLRWFALTLANIEHLVLRRINGPHRLFFVGPVGERSFDSAAQVLAELGAQPQDICAYHPKLTWTWGRAALGRPLGRFEGHGSDVCLQRRRPRARRLYFDRRWLPLFRRCVVQMRGSEDRLAPPDNLDGSDRGPGRGCRACEIYNASRSQPCSSAVSLIMQLWQVQPHMLRHALMHCCAYSAVHLAPQSAQSLALIQAAERRSAPYHDTVLRLRPDLFLLYPVELPRPAQGLKDWYTLFEESCVLKEGVLEMPYGRRNAGRFFQDWWLYGSRSTMVVALAEPLQRLLEFGSDAAAFQACARCHVRPTSFGAKATSCCDRSWENRRSTPKYDVHPVPEALNRRFNASAQCLRYDASTYGLMRVNTAASCFMVQARLPNPRARFLNKRYGKSDRDLKHFWRQLDLMSDGKLDLLTPEHEEAARTRLRGGIAALYRRCFGLVSNRSCERTVGDRKLFTGPEAPCLRSRAACADEDLRAADGTPGFACVQSGLLGLVTVFDQQRTDRSSSAPTSLRTVPVLRSNTRR